MVSSHSYRVLPFTVPDRSKKTISGTCPAVATYSSAVTIAFSGELHGTVGFLPQPGKLFIRHALVIFICPDLLGIPIAHPGNGVLGVVAIHHRHIVAFEVVEVTRRQHGKGGFADPALLGGKGDIKGCFLVFHIASVHYWLIDLFIAFNHSVFLPFILSILPS